MRARLALPAAVDLGAAPTTQMMAPAAPHLRVRRLVDFGDDADDGDQQLPIVVPAAPAAPALPAAALPVAVTQEAVAQLQQ